MIRSLGTMLPIKREQFSGQKKCQKAFDTLKVLCTSTPILAFADSNKPFKLHTNASAIELGVVLYQEQDGKDRVIGYASWALSTSES